MDLPLLSAFFVAVTLTLYVMLDGFDLGVGVLLLLQPTEKARDHMVDSITPTWDGNETWIIMAAVTLLAAFPVAYSILLPAVYIPVILMLLSLGLRGVSFEFRVQSVRHRRKWDMAFAIGSLVAGFMQGLILGSLLQGVRVEGMHFNGSVLDVFRPLPLICGLALVLGYTVLGAGWLILKSNAALQHFATRWLRVASPLLALLFGAACIYAATIQPDIRSAWTVHPIALPCLVGLFAIGAGTLAVLPTRTPPMVPLGLGLSLFVECIAGIAVLVFPDIVPFRVSLWDASSSSLSQEFVLIGAVCVTPVILGYSAFAYWVFRGRTPEEGWGE
jgi:cytochrome bd ubiquinol oxidase subunit II